MLKKMMFVLKMLFYSQRTSSFKELQEMALLKAA
jgi:hypothetical protein